MAILLLVYTQTQSALLTGITQAAVLLPILIAGPVAGVYADRNNRRTLLIASNLVQGVITAVVAVLYAAQALALSYALLLILVLYSGAQFYQAASSAIIPRIVSKEHLGAANGLLSLTSSSNQLVSYAFGGVIIGLVGKEVAIAYDCFTFFFAAVMMSFIARAYGGPQEAAADPQQAPPRRSYRKDFGEGIAYVRQNRLFRQLIVFGLFINFFGGAVFAILVPYTIVWIKGDASTYGFLLAAFALGSILGAVVVGKLDFRGYVGRLLYAGVLVFGLLIAVSGAVTTVPVALVLFAAQGVLIAAVNIPLQVLVQTQVPGELLGRASTVLRFFIAMAQPVAAVVGGLLATYVMLGPLFISFGACVAGTSVALFVAFPELRNAKY